MPQQDDAIGTTFIPGTSASVATAAGKAEKLFWWQCPWMCAAGATGRRASRGLPLAENSDRSSARDEEAGEALRVAWPVDVRRRRHGAQVEPGLPLGEELRQQQRPRRQPPGFL